MMNIFIDFLQSNSALLVAVIALFISLRANWTAHKAHELNVNIKAETDRRVFAEKHRELLNELDSQYTKLATLAFVTAHKIKLFKENPALHESHSDEFARLKSNLGSVEVLRSDYPKRRITAEQLSNSATDSAEIDTMLSKVRQLTIHVEKDIRHEESALELLRSKTHKLSQA
ncbi:hypothetical protein ACMYR3_06925 [Ampullimonas aquatilis]|uniref:hypothetical protein n=1 Tax=Ampullimonas aquatilis TaxID=1341549 RepID=UPI003C713812